MIYGIYQSAAGLMTNQYRQDILANNLANVGTVGFKHDLAVVRERQVQAREGSGGLTAGDRLLDGLTGGSLVAPTYTSFVQGPLEETDRPLDAALVGEGFFAVNDGQGERYTRDGRFTINARGELVTVSGAHRVLDEAGGPIVVPGEAAGSVRLHADGSLRVGNEELGRLRIVDFQDKDNLRKQGGNLFQAVGERPTASQAELRVGMVEQSTVDPMQAMVAMIESSRAYQLNATMIGLADATLSRAVNDIPRLR